MFAVYTESVNELNKVVLIATVFLILPKVENEDDNSEHRQYDDGDVDNLVDSFAVGEQRFEFPIPVLLVNEQFAVGDDGRPLHYLSDAFVPNCQIFDVVIGSTEATAHEGQLEGSVIPLGFLVEKGDSFATIQFGDAPLNGDAERIGELR
jgi:hypothetical protein